MNLNKKTSRLSELIELSSSVKFYVPSTTDIDTAADSQLIARTLTEVESALAGWFGGATSVNALGLWQSPTAGLVREKVTVVQSYCNEDELNAHIDEVVELAEKIKSDLAQDSIAIEVNNKLYLV